MTIEQIRKLAHKKVPELKIHSVVYDFYDDGWGITVFFWNKKEITRTRGDTFRNGIGFIRPTAKASIMAAREAIDEIQNLK